MPRDKATPKKNAARTYTRRSYSAPSRYGAYRPYYRRYYSRMATPRSITFPQFAVAQIDPFDPAARGVRVPDESTAPSSAFKLYDQSTLFGSTGGTPVANEMAVRLYFPNTVRFSKRQSNTSNSTTAVTWGSTWASDSETPSKAAAVTAQYSVARPVAHGVRLSCPLAPTTVTGFCHVALISIDTFGADGDDPSALASAGKLPTTVSDMRELPHYRRCTLASLTQESMTVVNRFLDTTAFRYISTNSDELTAAAGGQDKGTFHVPSSWMAIVVLVEGHGQAAGTTVLTVEHITHFEGQTKTAGLNSDDSAETANPDVFDSTASAAGKTKASYFQSEQTSVAQAFSNELFTWIKSFGRQAARTTARRAGTAAAGFAIPYAMGAAQRAYGMAGMPGINNLARLNA